jgi:PP-loop superfamily ATP-utilizing enzyme
MNKEMFIVNKDVLETKINSNVETILKEIQTNCQNGVNVTEVTSDNFFETRSRINSQLKELGVEFVWLDMGGYVSYSVGNGRRFGKIKILS